MNSYNFVIQNFITQDIPGYERVVVKIVYGIEASNEDGSVITGLSDTVDLPLGDFSQRFIHFEQITRSEAMIWLNSAINPTIIDQQRAKLDAEIERIAAAMLAKTTLVTHMPWDETVDGVATIPDQQLIPPGGDSLIPEVDSTLTPPGCYLLDSDGSLKILESIVDPTVQ